jgi:hypothetical protein
MLDQNHDGKLDPAEYRPNASARGGAPGAQRGLGGGELPRRDRAPFERGESEHP